MYPTTASEIFRRTTRLLLASAALLAGMPAARVATAQTPTYTFKQLRIGGAGFVTGIATHPTTAGLTYARTDTGGAYRWSEANGNWTQLITSSGVPNPKTNDVQDYEVESIAISASNNQTVYVSVGSGSTGRVLRSNNQGSTWSDSGQTWYINGNGDYRQGGERLAVDPQNDAVAYLGTREQGLWRTTNSGGSWTQISTSSVPAGNTTASGYGYGIRFVAFDPKSGTQNGNTKTVYIGVTVANGVGGIYRSTDGGASFQQLHASSSDPWDARVASDSSLWVSYVSSSEPGGSLQRYVPANNQYINVSPTSGGNTWSFDVDPQDATHAIATLPAFNVSGSGVYQTNSTGGSWSGLSVTLSSTNIPWVTTTDEPLYFSTASLHFDGTVKSRVWLPQGLGAWRADAPSSSAITFNDVSIGLDTPIGVDVIAPSGVAITGIEDREGFYHSNPDGYPTRTLIDTVGTSPQLFTGNSLDYSAGTPGYIAVAEAQNNGTFVIRGGYSTNGGQTFQTFGSYPAQGIGGNIAVSASSTSNLAWVPTDTSFLGKLANGSADPNGPGGYFPYYSSDGGASWHQSSGVTVQRIHDLFFFPSRKGLDSDKVTGNVFYVGTDDANSANSNKFYVSKDGGVTYQAAANAPVCAVADQCHVFGQIRAVPGKANHVWSSDALGGLYYTTTAGASAWTKVSAVQQCWAFGFGATLSGASYPTVFIYGKVNNQLGVYRSSDQGATWQLATAAPLGDYEQVLTVNGDLSKAGRVYVGFNGSGFAYGDDTSLGGGGGTTTDTLTGATWPASVTPTGAASATISYSGVASGRTIVLNYWDANFAHFLGSSQQAVSGSGSVTLTVTPNQTITTSTAYMRAELHDSSGNVVNSQQLSNYNIPVTTVTDTLTGATWPASIPKAGPATATISYTGVGSGRQITLKLWDTNFAHFLGSTTKAVSGSGSVTISVTPYSNITTSTALLRAELQDTSGNQIGSQEKDNYNIPVK